HAAAPATAAQVAAPLPADQAAAPAASEPVAAPCAPAASRPFGLSVSKGLLAALSLIAGAALVWFGWRVLGQPGKVGDARRLKPTQVTAWSGLDVHPALAPDGRAIAYSSDHNGSFEIYVKPLAPGSREIQVTADGQQNFEPAWSPDGQYLAYHSM